MSFTEEYKQVTDYEKLLQDYKARTEKYQELLNSYESGKAAGRDNPDLKNFLDKERGALRDLYEQVVGMRQRLAQAQREAFA